MKHVSNEKHPTALTIFFLLVVFVGICFTAYEFETLSTAKKNKLAENKNLLTANETLLGIKNNLEEQISAFENNPIIISLAGGQQKIVLFNKALLKLAPLIDTERVDKDENVRLVIFKDETINIKADQNLCIYVTGSNEDYFFFLVTITDPDQKIFFRVQVLKEDNWIDIHSLAMRKKLDKLGYVENPIKRSNDLNTP